jgi:hypothetical protein
MRTDILPRLGPEWLRLGVKHVKPIVNLPGNESQYGDLIRSACAPKGKVFVNADLSSLEDKDKTSLY